MTVMVDPCLTVGEGVQLLADCGERERSRKSRRGAGLQPLMAQPAGQVVIAVRLRALLCALRTCRNEDVAGPYTYALACIPLTVAAIVNSALSLLSWARRIADFALVVNGWFAGAEEH